MGFGNHDIGRTYICDSRIGRFLEIILGVSTCKDEAHASVISSETGSRVELGLKHGLGILLAA